MEPQYVEIPISEYRHGADEVGKPLLSDSKAVCLRKSARYDSDYLEACGMAIDLAVRVLGGIHPVFLSERDARTPACPCVSMEATLHMVAYGIEHFTPEKSEHPLFLALTQSNFDDFKEAVAACEQAFIAESITREFFFVFASGSHQRLGAGSVVRLLEDEVLRSILGHVLRE